jgi:hypothetical protein
MQPAPQLLELPDIDVGLDEDYNEEDMGEEDGWEKGLDLFLATGYEDQELPYFQLHPHLLLAAQKAVEQAALEAKGAAETKAQELPDTTEPEAESEHAGLLDG